MVAIGTIVQLVVVGFVGRIAFARSHRFRFAVRMTLMMISIAVASLFGVASSLVLYGLGLSHLTNHYVGRVFYSLTSLLTGMRCTVEGREHLDEHRPCVILCNHQSMLDMLTLGAVFPVNGAILAKKELKWYPFMGWYMQLAQYIFIERGNRQSALETMGKVARMMKEQKCALWMYPEGTRSHQKDKTLLPFKKGAFHLGADGNMPIVPIVCATYYPCYSEHEMIFEPGTIQIKILPPIDTTGLASADIDSLLKSTQELMQDTLAQLRTIPLDPSTLPNAIQPQ
eukprot:jgi/Hompol1/276/HPOL_002469-RA